MKKELLHIDIVTLFPRFFDNPLRESILKIAQEKKIVSITTHDVRQFTRDRHRTCDDKPFGGGPGMVMKPEPIFACIETLKHKRPCARVIFLTPQGTRLDQKRLGKLTHYKEIILLCGHYEGVDQRVRDHLVDEEISIGDYVLTGGEIPALCVIDGMVRLLPGVLGNAESLNYESFQHSQLEYPQYTRPRLYRSFAVPEVLASGNHKAVAEWRRKESLRITKKRRKDLFTTHKRKKGHAL